MQSFMVIKLLNDHTYCLNNNNNKLSVESQKGVITKFNKVPLRTRRALSLCKVYMAIAPLLVLNGTLLKSVNALLVLSQRYHYEG